MSRYSANSSSPEGNGPRLSLAFSDGRTVSVRIGYGVLRELDQMWPGSTGKKVIITQRNIPIPASLEHVEAVIYIADGEGAKTLAEVERVASILVEVGVTRKDLLIGLGGGTVTDFTGFVASIFHRGMAYLNAPTTLLAMIDAAIGGKTGVNLALGKNLVGTFYQPIGVLMDLDLLATLPEREWQSGRGEMAKYEFLGVQRLWEMPLLEQVVECVRYKAKVVAKDERDSADRERLNYGHSVGHALEALSLRRDSSEYLSHGAAVAKGLYVEALIANRLGRVERQQVARCRSSLERWGFDLTSPPWAVPEQILSLMSRDKKNFGVFRLALDGSKGVEVVDGVPRDEIFFAVAQWIAEGNGKD